MKVISAKEAKDKALESIDAALDADLTQVMEAIENAAAEGKFQVTIDRIGAFPESLPLRLMELGYKVKYGTSFVRNELLEDLGKLVISWE